MNRSISIFTCILLALNTSHAATEDRRVEIDNLLFAYRLAEGDRIATAWVAREEQNAEGPDLANALAGC